MMSFSQGLPGLRLARQQTPYLFGWQSQQLMVPVHYLTMVRGGWRSTMAV